MPDELNGLPPHIIAALKAPQGTTVEDFLEAHPRTPTQHDAEFVARLEEACFEWHSRNSWLTMPYEVRDELAKQVRFDMEWERNR
ncbi:hypothetical protein [Gordonia sputi]|uniref:hypothetical protein n=1 Tax=Gordonia sputi TaxID=36823 RepID=UPI002044455C|nr:hypothetical protein [Gordonia sputi]MCM3897575.1 hypothetical protein [Gordonia sputi]